MENGRVWWRWFLEMRTMQQTDEDPGRIALEHPWAVREETKSKDYHGRCDDLRHTGRSALHSANRTCSY